MFLEPEVTRALAARVGHFFHDTYDAAPGAQTYADLLDRATWTRKQIAALSPRDNIDVQCFIWVVGKYLDPDRARPEGCSVDHAMTDAEP